MSRRVCLAAVSTELESLFVSKINESFGRVLGVYDEITYDLVWVKIESDKLSEVAEGARIPVVDFQFSIDGTVSFHELKHSLNLRIVDGRNKKHEQNPLALLFR